MLRPVALVLPLLLLAACAEVEDPARGETIPGPAPSTGIAASDSATAAPATGEAGACASVTPPPDDDALTVVFFGNSLTAGYGLANPAEQAYPALVERMAREAGLDVRAVNAGVSGETSAGGLRRIAWALGGTRPDVFVLALGANDGLRGLDPAAMEENLSGILACVREAVPEARLVVAGMEAPPNMGADYTARFRAVFPAIADRFDAARVPFLLEGVGGVPALNQPDGVHPTAEGQRVMAETVWATLGPVLREAARREG